MADPFTALAKRIRAMLAPKAKATSDEIDRAIAELDERRPTIIARVEAAEERVADVLIAGEPADVVRERQAVATVQAELDQLEAMRTRLERRLEEAKAAEATATLDAEIEAAGAASDRGVEILNELNELTGQYILLVEELQSIDKRVEAARTAALAANRQDEVPQTPNHRVRPFAPAIADFLELPQCVPDGPFFGTSRHLRIPRPQSPAQSGPPTKESAFPVPHITGEDGVPIEQVGLPRIHRHGVVHPGISVADL